MKGGSPPTVCAYPQSEPRVFKSGNSRAVRLPKKFRVKSKELETEKPGNEIILRERPVGMERAFYLLTELVNLDALKKRKDDKPRKRKGL
jgi:antitoxin VapB